MDNKTPASLIKLTTGETIICTFVGMNNATVHIAFPYIIHGESMNSYLPNTINRQFMFPLKEIVLFKDCNESITEKYVELVLAKESEEYKAHRESTEEVKIPTGCYFHLGNETVH